MFVRRAKTRVDLMNMTAIVRDVDGVIVVGDDDKTR